jgi:hypothetical protein
MRIQAVCIAVTLAVAASCTDRAGSPAEVDLVTVPLFSGVGEGDSGSFRAHAHGGEEVPPVDTRAQGQAIFRLSEDGDEISYKVIVANIVDVTQSHIHLAPAGVTGGIVVWLYPSAPPAQLIPGRSQGVLAEGEITEEDLVGGLADMDLEALLDALRTGGAYVNVHTVANPPGEIRGQIR